MGYLVDEIGTANPVEMHQDVFNRMMTGTQGFKDLMDQQQPNEGEAKYLPITAKRLYGCLGCDWRGTVLCPFSYLKVDDSQVKEMLRSLIGSAENPICRKRVNYLLSFYSGDKQQPSFTEWRRDYSSAIAHVQSEKDRLMFQEVEDKIKEYEKEVTIEEESLLDKMFDDKDAEKAVKARIKYMKGKLEDMKDKMNSYRIYWKDLMEMVLRFDDKQIDRDTVKKVDVTTRKEVTLGDIQKVMSGDIIDAKGTEVKVDGTKVVMEKIKEIKLE